MPVSDPDVSRPRLVRDATFLEADRREIDPSPAPVDRGGLRARPDLALAGADGASATALQPPPHLLTTLPAPAGGGSLTRTC